MVANREHKSSIFSNYTKLRLSDSFEDASALGKQGSIPQDLELIAHVYNINVGHNEGLLQKDATLEGYAVFIEKIREFEKELLAGRKPKEMPKEYLAEIKTAAMTKAIRWCVARDTLKSFLQINGLEILNMTNYEWNFDDALVVERKEGLEEGLAKGREEGQKKRTSEILRLIDSGSSIEDLKRVLTAEAAGGNAGQ